jgi:hypothetical protein
MAPRARADSDRSWLSRARADSHRPWRPTHGRCRYHPDCKQPRHRPAMPPTGVIHLRLNATRWRLGPRRFSSIKTGPPARTARPACPVRTALSVPGAPRSRLTALSRWPGPTRRPLKKILENKGLAEERAPYMGSASHLGMVMTGLRAGNGACAPPAPKVVRRSGACAPQAPKDGAGVPQAPISGLRRRWLMVPAG